MGKKNKSLEALWSAVPSAQEVLPGPAVPNAPEEATAADPKSHLPATTAADGRPLTKLEIKRMKRAARPGRQPVGAPAAAAGPSPSSAAEAAVTAAARSERHPDQLKPSSAATASDDPTATKKKSSGTGNADEAQKIREALGYVAPSSLGTSEEPVGKKHKTEEKEGKNKKKKAKCEEGQGRDEEREPINLSTTSGLVSVTKPEDAVAPKPSAAGSKGVKFGFGFQLSEAQAAMETESKVSRIMLIDSATPEGLVPRRVFICGMPHEWDEDIIREYWGYCGEIESLDMLVFPDSGNFNGVMFLTFASEEGYEKALACNGEELEGRTLRVEKCKAVAAAAAAKKANRPSSVGFEANAPQRHDGYNVAYVGNIAYDVTREELIELFKPYKSNLVRLHTDKDTGRPKGYAHVHFPDALSLEKAMELNGHDLNGRCIKMSFAQPKKT